jgi:uncharacterized protein (TIGR03435 family)
MQCRGAVFLLLVMPAVNPAQPAGHPAFDAVSVKPADPQAAPVRVANDARATLRGGPGSADPGRISYTNVTLQTLLISAYGVGCRPQGDECDQLVGPAWLRSERYDLMAALPSGTTNAQFQLMLQDMLADRFRVTVHHETRDLPGLELTVGKIAKRLVKAPEADAAADSSGPLVKFGAIGEYPQLLRAGFIVAPYPGTMATGNHLIAREQSLPDITKMLSTLLSAHVVDKTGLTGKYNFTFDWVPEGVTLLQAPDAPEVFLPHGIPTAIEDQLGLKLMRTKLPLDVVIVDSAEKAPTAN